MVSKMIPIFIFAIFSLNLAQKMFDCGVLKYNFFKPWLNKNWSSFRFVHCRASKIFEFHLRTKGKKLEFSTFFQFLLNTTSCSFRKNFGNPAIFYSTISFCQFLFHKKFWRLNFPFCHIISLIPPFCLSISCSIFCNGYGNPVFRKQIKIKPFFIE